MGIFNRLFNFAGKKPVAAEGFAVKETPPKQKINAFILEQMRTPSGLLDDGSDLVIFDTDDFAQVELPDWGNDFDGNSLDFDGDGDSELSPEVAANSSELGGDESLGLLSDNPDDFEDVPFIDSDDILNDGTDLEELEFEDVPFADGDDLSLDNDGGDGDDGEILPIAIETPSPVFESGVFTVGDSGQVQISLEFDGGKYDGELAIFSLDGMEQFEPGSHDFIREAASRALSDSVLGHVVISDRTEGARFFGELGESDWNEGEYLGVKTFEMRSGDEFGFMLIPNSTVQEVFDNPAIEGAGRPLFSLATANPNDAFHVGQIADVTGDGTTFVMEDLRVDTGSDYDYNDIIFRVSGATGKVVLMDGLIDPAHDWRTTELGQEIIASAIPEPVQIDFNFPGSDQPLIGIIDTGFSGDNPDIDYSHIILGRDRVDGDDNPLLPSPQVNDNPLLPSDIANGSITDNLIDGVQDNDNSVLPSSQVNQSVTNNLTSSPQSSEHGTHILGIIGATQDNGIGIDGINDDAPIWVGRAVGSGKWAESLVEFVDKAIESDQPNAVVNLSLDLTQINQDGSTTTRYEFTPQERAAIEYARQNHVLIVAAAGNDGGVMSVLGQASQEFDNIITVGASDGLDRADYSSYGNGLDIVAPGGTTEYPVLSTTGNSVGSMAGTSVATARVTGAASQVWAANPQLDYRQVIEILKATATDLKTPGWDGETGAGLLDIAAAVSVARTTTPVDYEIPATLVPETWSGEGKVTPTERAANAPLWPTVASTWFTGRVMATLGANVRSGPGTNFSIVGGRGYNNFINFDGWTYGERITDIALGTPDERWYRIAGTNDWIASAIIDGNAPGSTPLPPAQPPTQPPPPPIPYVPINSGSANYRDGRQNPFAYNWQGQCTWYAYGRMLETGLLPAGTKQNGWFLGNAESWRRDAQRAGLPITSTPTAGARGLVVWPPGVQGGHRLYGHVAFLEEVYPDGRIRISESNWAGRGISERILTPAQYSGLAFVRLENAAPNPQFYSPPAVPGQQREYRVRSGDTLWGIAQRELGNGNRWREIQKPGGGTFTEAEAQRLQVGQSVYLPVSYQSGTGTPVTPPSSGTPTNINWVNFSGTVGPSQGVNLRYSPRFSDRSSQNEPYGKTLQFDAWTYGEVGTDMWLGTPDARWFKVKGTNLWVPSAYIYGNPPNSTPMPGSGSVGSVEIIGEPINSPSDPNGTLGTAHYVSDMNVSLPGSIGYNGDQNDFLRFGVANNRTNVNLTLGGLSADADLELIRDWNNNGRVDAGEVIGQSLNSGTSVDSVSRILDSGDYFVRVLPGTPSARTSYNLKLSGVELTRSVRVGNSSYTTNLWHYKGGNKTNAGIESNKDTVVVIHGWNKDNRSQPDDKVRELVEAVSSSSRFSNAQVLALDWGEAAYALIPFAAAYSIGPVAQWAASRLRDLGINSGRITLMGHSLGSHMSSEVGRVLNQEMGRGKVGKLFSLDAAYPAGQYDFDPGWGWRGVPKFSDAATYSLALVASDKEGGTAGDNDYAGTATYSFIVRFNGYNGNDKDSEYHSGVVSVYKDLVTNWNSPSVDTDEYDNDGNQGRWGSTHEGRIEASKNGSDWRVTGVFGVRGSEQISWV
ncbi:S8 family serine peptidase [Limnofasciculus baicalensis]|uniref:S8 family serine peptidase n=1 Tax=Limnofasciculus baicalensis BBK-W-15 TaxID=2699891 RepID=A0AAE3KPV6_9CYAN|nr:S8 family serine peptidase [Limnofasciculus baicalensis]MCP2730063.1 S8 family serine peptidase [Limnofasciculus baicalensis BBK-W-15]